MSHANHSTIERHCDVAVIGGSAAGLAAALQLARQCRSVIVIDGSQPRNQATEHIHSFLGYDGRAPGDLLSVGRKEVRRYGTEILDGQVEAVAKSADGKFVVSLPDGNTIVARRVIAATGLTDQLHDIPGLSDQWGRGVIHCPFCHGYEARDQGIVMLVTNPMGLHAASLYWQLTKKLTLVLHAEVGSDDPALDRLRTSGISIVEARAIALNSNADGSLTSVTLDNGQQLPAQIVAITPPVSANIAPFTSLGLEATEHPSGMGTYIPVEMTGVTTVPGLYAAGSLTNPSFQMMPAAAHGSQVGAFVGFTLVDEELDEAGGNSDTVTKMSTSTDWDYRYRAGDRMWSGNPNGSIVTEASLLSPGTALDIGAGEGADSIWLTEQGWTVTTNDISQVSLGRAAAEAERRGFKLTTLLADINVSGALGDATYDLVSLAYASFPKTPDSRGIGNVLAAVAPGGTLLLVGHDLAPTLSADPTQSRPFDHHAYVQPAEVAELLEATDGWEILVNELRPRPSGHVHTGEHRHVDDIVVRARRLK